MTWRSCDARARAQVLLGVDVVALSFGYARTSSEGRAGYQSGSYLRQTEAIKRYADERGADVPLLLGFLCNPHGESSMLRFGDRGDPPQRRGRPASANLYDLLADSATSLKQLMTLVHSYWSAFTDQQQPVQASRCRVTHVVSWESNVTQAIR